MNYTATIMNDKNNFLIADKLMLSTLLNVM